MKLTKKEIMEDPNITIGRLRGSIRNGTIERSLALLEKITIVFNHMEIELMHTKFNN